MEADWICAYLLLLCLTGAHGQYQLDMELTDVCTRSIPQDVQQYDTYIIFAYPPQDGRGTRDRCTVKFRRPNGGTFKLYVRNLQFRECQIYIKMYDGDMNLNTAKYKFDCHSAAGGLYYSSTSEIAISLEKPDSTSTGYKFDLVLAASDGPDIGGVVEGQAEESKPPTTAALVGIGIAAIIVLVVVIAVVVYLVFVYRRKKEEKELEMEMGRSRSTLFPPSTTGTVRGGSSVHSSVHSSHHSTHSTHATKDNKAFVYPAFRTKPSISEKAATCNSIDTLTNSEDRESVFTDDERDGKRKPAASKPGKDVSREFDSMRRGLLKDTHRKEREKQDLREQELRRQEAREFDRQGRANSNRGLGRSNRRRENRIISTDNIKGSLREARNKGRSLNDSHGKSQRDTGFGSTRSSKSKNRSHSPARSAHSTYEYRDEIDYHSDDNRHRSRDRVRSSNSRSKPRSASSSSQSRSKRDYYDEREDYSDYDDRRRHRSRDRYDDGHDGRRSRRDTSNHRSGNQRSRSQSAGRSQRS